MKKRFFASLFLFVLLTQMFPMQGIQFWYHLLKFQEQIEAPLVQVIEEENFEEYALKLNKQITSYSDFLVHNPLFASKLDKIRPILRLGNIIDRADPVIIPPPNQLNS